MIDRQHELPVTHQAKLLKVSRGSVYYLPKPVSEADLALMRRSLVPARPLLATRSTPTCCASWTSIAPSRSTKTCCPSWPRLHKMKSLVRPELPTASVGSSQATTAAMDNSAPLANRLEST